MRVISKKTVGKDANGEDVFYMEIYGTSAETKPFNNVASGSTFTEVDTGISCMYSEEAAMWFYKAIYVREFDNEVEGGLK